MNTDATIPAPNTQIEETNEKDPVFLGPIIGVIIVMLVIALGMLFLWGSAKASAEVSKKGLTAQSVQW